MLPGSGAEPSQRIPGRLSAILLGGLFLNFVAGMVDRMCVEHEPQDEEEDRWSYSAPGGPGAYLPASRQGTGQATINKE